MSHAKEAHAARVSKRTKEAGNKYGVTGIKKSLLGISWDECDPQVLARFVHAVTLAGDAVTLGRTSDMGALSICILTGTERVKVYAADAEELHRQLAELTMLAQA